MELILNRFTVLSKTWIKDLKMKNKTNVRVYAINLLTTVNNPKQIKIFSPSLFLYSCAYS